MNTKQIFIKKVESLLSDYHDEKDYTNKRIVMSMIFNTMELAHELNLNLTFNIDDGVGEIEQDLKNGYVGFS